MNKHRDIFHNKDGSYSSSDGFKRVKGHGHSQTPLCLYHDFYRRRAEVRRVLDIFKTWGSVSIFFLSHVQKYHRKMDALVVLFESLHELRYHEGETAFPQ